jgi:hypothetical protein
MTKLKLANETAGDKKSCKGIILETSAPNSKPFVAIAVSA